MELSSQVLADGADVLLELFPSDDSSKKDGRPDPDRLSGAKNRAGERGESPGRWVEVLVDRPGNLDTYTYTLPPELGALPQQARRNEILYRANLTGFKLFWQGIQ
ncbi:MAG: hypothetical protein AAGM36_19325, partial [Cyanobacteria bacterium J06597_1]